MKQNTKFIWIYGAILFSFALILIVFAGLTQQETENVSHSLTSLTDENNKLKFENKVLKSNCDSLQETNNTLANENQNLINEKQAIIVAYGGNAEITKILLAAHDEKVRGLPNEAKARVKYANINVSSLTNAQKYIYDIIFGDT